MTDKDTTMIKVGKHSIGIIGLKQAMEEIAATHGSEADETVQGILLDRLGKDNYIPRTAREEYGRAFVKEFRRFLGQPFEEEQGGGIDIKVLGPGCAQCDRFEQTIMEVLTETRIAASVDHVRDIKEIARFGVMGTPALLINGKVMAVGNIPSRDKIRRWLTEAAAKTAAGGEGAAS